MRLWKAATIAIAVVAALAAGRSSAEDPSDGAGALAGLASKVNEIDLENGLRILVLEKHAAPTIACVTAVNVGSVDETTGETGLAHMFEHMAFKGSTTVGTKDWAKEKPALEEVEKRFLAMRDLKNKGARRAEIETAHKAFSEAEEEAGKFVEPEEYSKILERNGGSGLNAFTFVDQTVYHVELPSNRLELWFLLESDRFRDNILREFYKEKQAVEEERRMRTESSPQGQMFEEFLAGVFRAHPYGRPTIGWMSDLEALSATTARKFFDRYYTPDNMTISIVGDATVSEVKRLAEKYFGPMPRGPVRQPLPTIEPPQHGLRTIDVEVKARPVVCLAWHCPEAKNPDSDAIDALTDVLSSGRTSRLHQALIVKKKVAVAAQMSWGEPGQKYPNLIFAFAVPAPGKTTQDCVDGILEEVEKIKAEPVSEDELAIVKTRARANFLRGLRSNLEMAQSLSMHQNTYGEWKSLFEQPGKIAKLTPKDLLTVARKYLKSEGMNRGEIVKPSGNPEKEKD